MGAIESTEAGMSFWDTTLELGGEVTGAGRFEEFESEEEPSVDEREEEEGDDEGEGGRGRGRGGEEAEDYGSRSRGEEEENAAEAANEDEVTTNEQRQEADERAADQAAEETATTSELSMSKLAQVAPAIENQVAAATVDKLSSTEVITVLSRASPSYRDVPFSLLFVSHLVLVTAGIVYLSIQYFRDMTQRKLHNLLRWFPQLGAAVAVGSLFASASQTLFRFYPTFMAKAVLWSGSLLMFAASLMLISTNIAANLGVGVLLLIFSICQSLYSCWVSNRIKYAGDLLACSLKTARKVPGTYLASFWILLAASMWLVFWSFGVVSALSFKFAPLVVLALLASLTWTLETLRNVVYTTIVRSIATIYLDAQGASRIRWERSLHAAFTSCFGSICLGSLVVPTLHALRVLARGLNRVHGDDEFMFSCADCFVGVMEVFVRYAHNWAYVQVSVYNKSFVRASEDTWELFKSKQLNVLIDTDLTGSFCVASGIAGGMLCVLVSGGWTFGTHKALTLSISVVSFFIGYFLVRIAMAVPQGAVCAHYVCYGENPASPEFVESPLEERLKELVPELDIEAAKAV